MRSAPRPGCWRWPTGVALPAPLAAAANGLLTLREAERRHLQAALEAAGGSAPQAAQVLGVSRSALYEKLRKHGLARRRGRA